MIVEVTRGDLVESVHRVAACASDHHGNITFERGPIDVPVYLRSTAKPFIAAAAVRAGAVERFGFDTHEIALMAASHNGEPFHVAAVRSMLRKIGVTESALACGPHAPYDAASAEALAREGVAFGPVHNNCSGKHAGIIALSRLLGADVATYRDPESPAQREILALCARACDASVADLPLGVDGCGIPVFAVSLRKAALAFARLATLEGLDDGDARALRIVRDAMVAAPEYVAGTGEFDTALMRAARGGIVAKSGAEGVHGLAHLPSGTGLVLKIADGAARAVPPATMEIARRLRMLDGAAARELEAFTSVPLFNRAGFRTGTIRSRDATEDETPRGTVPYDLLERQVRALLDGERNAVANAANFAAFVYQEVPDLNWAGFYFAEPSGDLVLGPFGGPPACTRLPHGRGVCGAAFLRRGTVVVDDVAAFEDHIVCDSASRSEMVVPFFSRGAVAGVFDVDSPRIARFNSADRAGIERLVAAFGEAAGYGGGGGPPGGASGGGPSGGGAAPDD
jgi:L-asparaginase II/putative methionine-R-sulfoxide reductase with GAF domain